jgi:CO/xanthine dehydrogenase Mo-binding subunit
MLPRREFLKAGGALIVGFSMRDAMAQAVRGSVAGPPDAKQLDTWLAIHADNTATVYIGFAELGQGCSTALPQIAAEELDLDLNQVTTVRLDTNITPNQGGTYSSASIARGGPQIRTAAAEARQALLAMASKRLDVPVAALTVERGVVSGAGQSVKYGELVGGKPFQIPFTGTAPLKPASAYKLVGTAAPRKDVPSKVEGRFEYLQYVRVPGMLHGRVVRPRGQRAFAAGAKIASIDETSIASIPGARVIRKGDFLGVVAEQEWDAVRAAQQLKVTWEAPPALPGNAGLHAQMRAAQTQDRIALERGNVAGVFDTAAHVVSKTYKGPYQSHAPFAPNCAIADVQADSVLAMCSTNDIYGTRGVLSRMLGMPQEKIRVQYVESSGTYGHSCFDDVTQAAVLLSQTVGKPVRVQFMRWDEHGWDTYGQPHLGEIKVAADAQGKLLGYEYHGWQHNWTAVEPSEQLAYGRPPAESNGTAAQQVSPNNLGAAYAIPHIKLVNHRVPGGGYFRASYLRSPLDLSFSFASEQAIDELAYKLGEDPYEFRKKNMTDPRWLGVLNAAAQAAKWTPRKAASHLSSAKVVTGRGIGVGTHLSSYGGAVAEIEVNKETGKVIAKHLFGAIDAGLVVNPGNVENQISGQLVQTASRMFYEEVTFDNASVTSLDWASYTILRFSESPEVTAVVVQRLNERSSGAGEEVMAACAAAIANAFFDATGVRMDEYPLTPKRVLTALKG